MSRHQPMSMEAMLDEERRDVLALLEGNSTGRQRKSTSPAAARSSSPQTNPRSPVRSMLDVGDDNAGVPGASTRRRGSIQGAGGPIRSMLDIDEPLPSQPQQGAPDTDTPTQPDLPSGKSSPVDARASLRRDSSPPVPHPRSMSDTNSRPNFGPRAPGARLDPASDYQFSDISTNNLGQALPKRNTQGGKGPSSHTGAMADVMRGNDLSGMALRGDRSTRHGSVSGPSGRGISTGSGHKSNSPHGRSAWRSPSPNVSGGFQQIPGTAVLDDGTVVDISRAYRKLSDANLAYSGGSLSELAALKRPSGAEEEPGSGRLAKDYYNPEGDETGYSSDEEAVNDTSDDEASRGRKIAPRSRDDKDRTSQSESERGDRQTLSLLAAAEEERKEVSSQQPQPGYKSLFAEPEITVTGPSGEKAKHHHKPGVHPTTAFDLSPSSGPASAMDSDEEQDLSDIKRAQKLAFSTTPVMSTPDAFRAIRIIYRGEYDKLQKLAEEENRRLRKYLVATDLSDESSHALEWTIGTVLRDGDTLIAIYCVDEETGIYSSDDVVPDEAKAHKEQAAAINAVTSAKDPPASPTPMFPHLARASALGFGSRSSSPAPGYRERERDRDRAQAEADRSRAVEDITERVTKLLRKTSLQVRVVVEVLHCKNPKHLITEVIDLVNPTLVILGSRGRSALKGVILGSFSNYLVTKSSVPVMVARKRLRKQIKYRRGPVRQVNNLSNPGTRSNLVNAKID